MRTRVIGVGAALLLALAGCSGGQPPASSPTTASPSSAPTSETPTQTPSSDPGVEIVAKRTDDRLTVKVRDNGIGLPEGEVGSGLGTQIVRTLIQGELSGTIDWHARETGGTEVTIEIPLRYIGRDVA